MAGASRTTTNVLLGIVALLLLLLLLYVTGVIAPRDEEAELRIDTPDGETTIDID